MMTEKKMFFNYQNVKKKSPLIHNITNYVVMNSSANLLLSFGASPIMAHAVEELEDLIKICNALVINIGTLDKFWINSIEKAITYANFFNKTIVFDPVGSGASNFRTKTCLKLIKKIKAPLIIKGNGSEIMSLVSNKIKTKGVESTVESSDAYQAALELKESFGATIIITGENDLIIDENGKYLLKNGTPLMSKVTGMGCGLSSILAAFVAANPDQKLEAMVSAVSSFNIAGEIAAEKSEGPGSFWVNLLDVIPKLTLMDFDENLKLEKI